MEYLTWDNDEEIAQALAKKYPDKPPVVLNHEQLRKEVIALEEFKDEPEPEHDVYLSAIQRSWIMLWHGAGAEKSVRSQCPED